MRDCFRVWFKLGVVHGPERMNERDVCAGRSSSVKLPLGLRDSLCFLALFLVSAHQRRAEPPGQSHLTPPYQLALVSGGHGPQRPLSTQQPGLGPATDPDMDLLGGLWRESPPASYVLGTPWAASQCGHNPAAPSR